MGKAKGDPKVNIWLPGQYCLINHNPSGTKNAEAKNKLGVPHQTHVYKIISADKDNFSYTVLNLQTGSTRQVNHSLIEGLSLDKLTQISFVTPTLYDGLVKLSNKTRNKYVPGRRDDGLHLLQPHEQGLDGPGRHSDPGPEEAQQHVTTLGEQDEHRFTDNKTVTELGKDPVEEPEEHKVTEGEQQIVTDSDNSLDEDRITESAGELYNPTNEPNSAEEHGGDTSTHTGFSTAPEKKRYNTRFLGRRHVPVFTSQVSEMANKQLTEVFTKHRGGKTVKKSLLKNSKDFPYNCELNYNPQELRKVDYPLFVTRRKALRLHKEVCEQKVCKTCELFTNTAGFSFNQLDFTRYTEQGDIPAPAGQNSKKTPSRVKFTVIETPGRKQYKPVLINDISLMVALQTNVSFSETKFMMGSK